MIDLRASAFLLHTPMCLAPGWCLGRVLHPIDNRCFVAPFQESPHHPPRGPESMKERIAASSFQSVRVQKARSASRKSETAILVGAALACHAARNAWMRKAGR